MCHLTHTTILTLLAALSVTARPSLLQSYELPQSGGNNVVVSSPTGSPTQSYGLPQTVSSPTGSPTTQGTGGSAVLGTSSGQPCTGEQVHNALGECVLPEISRNIYVYTAPNVITSPGPAPNIPKPEVHYNLVFVKTSDLAQQNRPIVVPPPQQKTLVYVLSKKQQQGGNNVIHAPYNPAASPEVYYVNYGQGDNPLLPGGVDLQTALSSAFSQGQNLNSQLTASGQNQGNNFVGIGQPQGNNFVGTGQNQGTNFVGTGQNQGNIFVGTGQNQGNNFVGNVIDGPTVSGGFVSPAINSPPIDGGIIHGDIVSGGIIDSGFGGGISLGQTQTDSGFGQGGHHQQPGTSVVINSPTHSHGGPGGFGQGGSGQGSFGQQPGSIGLQTSSISQGYQYPSPAIPLSPSQGGQSSLSQGSFNPSQSGPPSPPSRPNQLYVTPN